MALLFTVGLYQFRIGLAALLVVIRVPDTPLLLAIQHNLVVLGVIGNFLAVIIGASPTLALGLIADFLLGTIQGRQKTIFGSKDNGASCSNRLLSRLRDESPRKSEISKTINAI